MSTSYEGINKVVHISSVVSKSCPHCSESLKGEFFDDAVNHLLEKHDYQLLHVGSEWAPDLDSKSSHHTVAVLGKYRDPRGFPL